MDSIFSAVKEQVTARRAAEFYGIKVNRAGMACCPFHEDTHPSMKLDARFHCFGCGADGDAVDFAARYLELAPLEAAKQLAQDFGLDVSAYEWRPPRTNAEREARRKVLMERFERAHRLALHSARIAKAREAVNSYIRLLVKWQNTYAPKDPQEDWDLRFREAADNLEQMWDLHERLSERDPDEEDIREGEYIGEHLRDRE